MSPTEMVAARKKPAVFGLAPLYRLRVRTVKEKQGGVDKKEAAGWGRSAAARPVAVPQEAGTAGASPRFQRGANSDLALPYRFGYETAPISAKN
jgi:hypothetical protein